MQIQFKELFFENSRLQPFRQIFEVKIWGLILKAYIVCQMNTSEEHKSISDGFFVYLYLIDNSKWESNTVYKDVCGAGRVAFAIISCICILSCPCIVLLRHSGSVTLRHYKHYQWVTVSTVTVCKVTYKLFMNCSKKVTFWSLFM